MRGPIPKALGRAFGIERGDAPRAIPLALAYALVLASIYVLKPVRNGLFLAELGVGQIPYVLLLVAAVGGAFALVYGRLTRSLSVERLVQRTFAVLILMLGGFRFLLEGAPAGWVFYAFYVWVALYGLVTTSLVWLVANGVFDSREARRTFGFIGTGGIGGAIAGGWVTGGIAEPFGTENLLFVAMGLLGACMALLRLLPSTRQAPRPPRSEEAPASGFGAVAESPLLKNLALATGLIAATAVIVDVQFNAVVDEAFAARDEKTAFFGTFFAALSGFSFVFQLVITPLVLRGLGVGAALMILPAALGVGSLGLLVMPGLLSGIAAKSADGGFRHSIHKAASEVLFLPVPADVKKQSKLFLDTTVDTTATGLAALSVLLLTDRLGVPYASLSAISVVLIAGALVVIRRVRVAYVDAFRQALESRRLDLGHLRTSLAEAGAIELLQPALRSPHERQVAYALELLSGLRRRALVPELERLLAHPSGEIRRRALELRATQDAALPRARLEALTDDPDPGVRTRAFALLAERFPSHGHAELGAALESGSPERRAAALGALALLGPEAARPRLSPEQLERWLEDPSFAAHWADLARALGRLGRPELDPILRRLFDEGGVEVARAGIEGVAEGRSRQWLPWLIDRLAEPRLRSAIRAALVAFGADAVPRVAALLDDRRVAPNIRRALPRALGRIPTQTSVELLMRHVDDPDALVARAARRALAKLRTNYDELRFAKRRVRAAIAAVARRHFEAGRAHHALVGAIEGGPAGRLLLRSLREARIDEVESMLDLLTLRHPPADIERARRGLRAGSPAQVRASALELLDNVVEGPCREHALAVLDDTDPAAQHRRGRALFGGAEPSPEESLLRLLEDDNAWIRACAVHAAAEGATEPLAARLAGALEDPSPFVREAAARVQAERPAPAPVTEARAP
jgi:HEAT repeat protein